MVLRQSGFGHCCQKTQELPTLPEVPTSQLTNYKLVTEHQVIVEKRLEACTSGPQMFDPDRGVYQDHAAFLERRRRIGSRLFSVPPSSARRRALSRAIRASSPSRTRAVFSSTPASLAALRSSVSSIFSVVLICMNMHQVSIHVKRAFRTGTGHPFGANCLEGDVAVLPIGQGGCGGFIDRGKEKPLGKTASCVTLHPFRNGRRTIQALKRDEQNRAGPSA